jgi:hypothetical protein
MLAIRSSFIYFIFHPVVIYFSLSIILTILINFFSFFSFFFFFLIAQPCAAFRLRFSRPVQPQTGTNYNYFFFFFFFLASKIKIESV